MFLQSAIVFIKPAHLKYKESFADNNFYSIVMDKLIPYSLNLQIRIDLSHRPGAKTFLKERVQEISFLQ